MLSVLLCCFLASSLANPWNESLQVDENVNTGDVKDPTFLDLNPVLKSLTSKIMGYELVDGWKGRYKPHTDKKNWFDAQKVCEEEGANLLVINSPLEAVAVTTLLDKTSFYWIGLHSLYQPGVYVTVFNESLNSTGYSSWGPAEPNDTRKERCGVFGYFSRIDTGEYKLGARYCSDDLAYICEQQSVARQSSIPPAPHSLQLHDYDYIAPLGYYKFHEHKAKWQQAVDTCRREGAHLVILNSVEEARKLGETYPNYVIWTGVHDQYEEGNYVTIFNDTLESTGFSKWWGRTGDRDHNCVAFYYSNGAYGISDYNCNRSASFTCELEV